MTRPLLVAIHASFALVALAVAPAARGEEILDAADAAAEETVPRRSLAKTRLSLAAAIKIACERFPTGTVVEAYFLVDHGRLLYAVELIVGAEDHKEVRIDAISGAILKIDVAREDSDEVELERSIAKAKLLPVDALDKAQQRLPHSRPYDLRPDKQGGRMLIVVDALDGADMRRVLIDSENGEIVAVEDAKD